MKRSRRVEVVFGPLSSSQHLWVMKSDKCRREMLGRSGLLIPSEKSIWRCSIEHLIVQLLMVRRINLFTKWSLFRHFKNLFSINLCVFIFWCLFSKRQRSSVKESSCWIFQTALAIHLYFFWLLSHWQVQSLCKWNKHIFRTTFRNIACVIIDALVFF